MEPRKYLKKTQNSITEIGCVNSFDFRSIEFLADRLLLWTFVNINSSFCDTPSNLLKLFNIFSWLHWCWRQILKTKCWWQLWYVGDRLKLLVIYFIEKDTNIKKVAIFYSVTNISKPLWNYYHEVINIPLSPTSLYPISVLKRLFMVSLMFEFWFSDFGFIQLFSF